MKSENNGNKVDIDETFKEINNDYINDKFTSCEKTYGQSLYQQSPFYKSSLENIQFCGNENPNEFYNKAFFNIVLIKYMPYCTLW